MNGMKEHVLTGSRDAVLTNDGQGFAFTLMAAHGPLVRLRFDMDDFASYITHLMQVLAAVHPQTRPLGRCPVLSTHGIGVDLGDTPNTVTLTFQLSGMPLAVGMTMSTAADLGTRLESMGRSLQTLSASGPIQ